MRQTVKALRRFPRQRDRLAFVVSAGAAFIHPNLQTLAHRRCSLSLLLAARVEIVFNGVEISNSLVH